MITPDCVKDDLEEREINRASIGNHIRVVEYDSDNSSTLSTEETNDECEDSFLDSRLVTDSLTLSRSEESTTKSWEPHMHSTSTQTETSDHPLQKTMLELPRMMPCKPFMAVIPDSQSFLARITEAYKDVPDDNKPLITKMGLTADLELVDCAFGKVPKGCPLSYQCPVPSSKDYKTYDDAPPQPLLPMTYNRLEPMPPLSTLSASEQEHVNVMQITWEESHSLEHSTRACKKTVQELQRLRLTGRFKEICKLKPEQSNVDHLISKIQKGSTRCKNTQIEEEMKTEALREYCQNLCVNWYPCGLVIHPNAPWLGAVPDGLVYDPNEKHRFGLVHVKCIGFSSLIQCTFLTCRDGVLQLKTGHSLYWHIQGQMMVTGTSWCDLFVFSKEDLLVQRVYRDTTLIKVMEKNLHDFFFRHYLPHLFKTEVSP
ncbi:uncharacterized protein LOC113131059 isoform X2 [Mastacembelus armatus]|nr:uncharacterized protein LOC113131059 isoform X2 [Mastacembelus armatus]